MGRFLRENWLWILLPIALVAGLLAVVSVRGRGIDSTDGYEIR